MCTVRGHASIQLDAQRLVDSTSKVIIGLAAVNIPPYMAYVEHITLHWYDQNMAASHVDACSSHTTQMLLRPGHQHILLPMQTVTIALLLPLFIFLSYPVSCHIHLACSAAPVAIV